MPLRSASLILTPLATWIFLIAWILLVGLFTLALTASHPPIDRLRARWLCRRKRTERLKLP